VDYLAGRSELLCALFVLAAWLIFLDHFEERTTPTTAAKVLACGAAALLSKESGVCLAGLLIATDLYWKKESAADQFRKRWILYVPAILCTLAAAALIFRVLSHSVTAGFSSGSTPARYALTESEAILIYLRLFFLPIGQNVDWQLPVIGAAQAWPFLAGLAFLLAAIVVLYRRARLISFGLLVFLIALAPTSSFVPIADPLAERRMYLPIVGLIVAALGAIQAVREWRPVPARAAAIAAFVVLAVLGFASWHRSGVWSSDVALWSDAIARNPRNARAHANLGGAYVLKLDCTEAAREYALTVQLGGLDEVNGKNLGQAYECSHESDKALATYRRIVAKYPSAAFAWNRIGFFEGVRNNADAALAAYTTAIGIDPKDVEAYTYRGLARFILKDSSGARADLSRALELDPTNEVAKRTMERLTQNP
jgi:tetratricopeptide (TPR) repeat protein